MVKLCQQFNSHDAFYVFWNNDKFVLHNIVYCMCDYYTAIKKQKEREEVCVITGALLSSSIL
jgi:hypothetical protein